MLDGPDNPAERGPAQADNPQPSGPAQPSTPPPAGQVPQGTISAEAFAQLQQEISSIKSLAERYKQQNEGSRAELQRIQADTDRRIQEAVDRTQREWHTRMQTAFGGASPTVDQPISRKEALDAYYLRGDDTALDRYEQQQVERQREVARQEYAQLQAPAQFSVMVQNHHPDLLKNANSPEFQEVLAEYARMEADPVTRYFLGENPLAMYHVNIPDGRGGVTVKPMDLRLLDKAAYEVKLRRVALNGTPHPETPAVAGGPAATPDGGSAEPGPESILTAQEKDAIQALFAARAVPSHLPDEVRKSPSALMRWRVERLKKDQPGEYQARLERLRRVG